MVKKKAIKKAVKKRGKNTNFKVEYKCMECGDRYDKKSEVENCCEPCLHEYCDVFVECGDLVIYCNNCDEEILEGKFDAAKFKDYIIKNHKKCAFVNNVKEKK